MKQEDLKSSESRNAESIRNMVESFTQCADATSDLSDSIENFNKVYKNVDKNITKLKKIEDNISSNEQIKELISVTDSMTEVFVYFNKNLPKLTENISESKKEIESYKKIFKDMTKYFVDLNKEIAKTDLDFEKNLLSVIEQKIDSVMEAKTNNMMNSIKESYKSAIEVDKDEEDITNAVEYDTIYNLYINNSRKLPISVQMKPWTDDFYFTVDRIEAAVNTRPLSLIAYGKRYKEDKRHDNFYISADLKQFKMYQE